LRIAFFGLPLAALLLHADGHEIVHAGVCRRGALGTRRLVRILGRDRVSIMPRLTDASFASRLRATRPDLLVSWFWTKRIPESLLRLAPLGSVGVHPSLLPRHRGPDPYFWTILRGDREAGVSAHRLEREYDTGAVLGQKRIPVDPTWTAWTLAKRLDRPSLALLRDIVRDFAEGRPPIERPQDPEAATEAPSPSEEALRLDPKRDSAASLERLVRAASPYPGAVMEIEGEVIVVTRAAVVSAPRALAPGEAATVNGRAVVRAADTGLAVLAGRLVGVTDDDEIELGEGELAALVARLSHDAALA
jgi:methionyl-tRNA formyltransferase